MIPKSGLTSASTSRTIDVELAPPMWCSAKVNRVFTPGLCEARNQELAADAAALRRVIASLMDSASSLSLLLTQATPESEYRGADRSTEVLHQSEKLVKVGPLSDLEAAKLFVSVASRKEALQIPEMTAYGSAGEHTVVAFSKHPVIRLQRGNPGRIVQNAPKLQERTLTELTKLLQFEDTLAVMETKGLHRSSSSRKAMRISRLSASTMAPMLAAGNQAMKAAAES